jgi:hypothetical protein
MAQILTVHVLIEDGHNPGNVAASIVRGLARHATLDHAIAKPRPYCYGRRYQRGDFIRDEFVFFRPLEALPPEEE